MLKLFGLYDKVRVEYRILGTSKNSGSFIRENLKYLIQQYPLPDLDLVCYGDFDSETGALSLYDKPQICSWTDYKFPDTKAECLAPLGSDVTHAVQAFQEKVNKDKENSENV